MKILITGIDGFIGRNISAELAGLGHKLAGISNSDEAAGPFEFRRVDLRDRSDVFAVLDAFRPDLCIHLAAMAHVDVGPQQEQMVRSINVDGALNVIEACEASGCRKFIFFSSAKVLANTTSSDGVDENTAPVPEGIYARLKREVEIEILNRCSAGTLDAAIVRPVAVIGAGDTKGNYAKLIKMVRRGFFPLLDGGEARRSIVFVGSIALRIGIMVEKGIVPCRTYVFSDGTYSVREIVDAIRSATGYAFCPSVPSGPLLSIGNLADSFISALRPGSTPFRNIMNRLNSSFVVQTRNFEEDYGVLPEVDLLLEMRKVCQSLPK